MKLGQRLRSIADMVPKVNTVADIGTDHGYIPVYLIKNNICQKVIATDVNEGPLKKAGLAINRFKVSERVELRRGDGLEPLARDEAQAIIIAGMGGMLMGEMLKKGRDKICHPAMVLILQPMNAQDMVRKWLMHNGFMLTGERLAREGRKYYEIIVARLGFQSPPSQPIFYEIGKGLIENGDPLLRGYIEYKINICRNALRKLNYASGDRVNTRSMELEGRIKRYEEVLSCLANVKE